MSDKTKEEKARILEALVTLAAAFELDMSWQRQQIYLSALSALPVPDVLRAASLAIRTCKFFPSIAELFELASRGQTKIAIEDRAAQAWAALRQLSGSSTYRQSALDEDSITRKCFKALGGAQSFGVWDFEKQEEWKRKQFLSLYQAYARTQQCQLELDHKTSVNVLNRLTAIRKRAGNG